MLVTCWPASLLLAEPSHLAPPLEEETVLIDSGQLDYLIPGSLREPGSEDWPQERNEATSRPWWSRGCIGLCSHFSPVSKEPPPGLVDPTASRSARGLSSLRISHLRSLTLTSMSSSAERRLTNSAVSVSPKWYG